jgi:RHS repeat-associated protein
VSFTYTSTGKRQTMTDPSGVTTYTYDPQTDRLVSKQTPFGTISYTYDAAGDVTEISSSNQNGAVMAYQYDKLNRLSTVTVPGQSPTLYSYDAVGNLSGYTYPNGVATTLQYDPLNRLTSLASQGAQGAVASYAYTLGAAGNRTGATELSGRTVAYGYDNLYRLTSETIANAPMSGTVGYVYDAVGNRKQISSTLAAIPASGLLNYDANDRTATDTYDNNGNIISQSGIADTYDFENHLTQHGFITYVYDGDGNRVAKRFGGVTTNYLVDTMNPTGYAQVLDELQSNTVARSYTWGLQLVSESQLADSPPPASPWGTSWYGFDGHGSVRYITNSTGAITDTYDYDAFGNLVYSTGSTANNYLFAGEQFDPELGLYYNRARYLDVRSGRFWGMDTDEGNNEDPASLHKYLYAGANPVDRVDPSGHDFDIISTVGALAVQYPLVTMTLVSAGIGGATGCVAGMLDSQSTCKSGFLSGMLLGAVLGPLGGAASPTVRIVLSIGMSGLGGYSAYQAAKRGDYGLAVFDVVMSLGLAFLTAKCAYTTFFDNNEPLPPGWNSNWLEMGATRAKQGLSWFDESGGEWRYHDIQLPHHPTPHWDYNPWTAPNSPWQNIFWDGSSYTE